MMKQVLHRGLKEIAVEDVPETPVVKGGTLAPMRVVQLGPFPPPHGGVQTNLVAIRNYLREHGHSCAVINITRHRKQESDDVYYPHSAPSLIWDLLRKHYDVVHLHVGGMVPLRVSALALVCASVPWAKSVFTLHSGGYPCSEEGRGTARNSFRAFVLRRFDSLIGVNTEIINFFHRLGVAPARTRLIAPHSFASAQVADRLSEPLASFCNHHERILVAVCSMEPEYDLPTQIRALKDVLPEFPSIGLAILGSGGLERELRKQIAATTYADHVLLCGDVPHSETLRAIAGADALLRTTLYDGDAISIREAIYLGTPVIATENGMRPEGVNLVPIGDVSALSVCIKRVLAEGKPVRGSASADHSNLAEVVEIYTQLFSRS